MRSISQSQLVYRAIDFAGTSDCSEKAQEIRFSIIPAAEAIFTDRLCADLQSSVCVKLHFHRDMKFFFMTYINPVDYNILSYLLICFLCQIHF